MAQETIHLSVPITKAAEQADGSVFVEGIATNDVLDLDNQIIDREFALKGLTNWFSDWGNIRQMHSGSLAPAGVAAKMENRPEGIWIRAHVYEPGAVLQVKNGGYKAFSVGIAQPRIAPDLVAKGGRIVDGIFSEISLVDFPANPTAKFMIAKRRYESSTSETEVVAKVMGADVEKRDFDQNVGGGTDRDKIPAEDFAGPHKSYPIVTPKDVADAAHLVGKAEDPAAVKRRIIAIAKRKGPEFVAKLPASWKGDSTSDDAKKAAEAEVDTAVEPEAEKALEPELEKAADTKEDDDGDSDAQDDKDSDDDDDKAKGDGKSPAKKSVDPAYHLMRLHDATCPAYSGDDAAIAHPTLVRGIPGAVSVQAFSEEVTKALTPTGMAELSARSSAFQLAVELSHADPGLLEAGMEELRKSFARYYPDTHVAPGSITPGQFDRGFLSEGRASLTPGAHPRIPLRADVPAASDFQRAPLSEGQERSAPANKDGDPDVEKRSYYTNSAKESAASALSAMHNYIADNHPQVCALHQPGGTVIEEPVVPQYTPDMKADSTLEPVHEVSHAVSKAADIEAIVTKSLDGRFGDLVKTIETLSKRVEELEAAPDPATAVGRSGALTAYKQAKPEVSGGTEDSAAAAASLVRLVKQAKHHDSLVSIPALERLMKDYSSDVVTKLLGS